MKPALNANASPGASDRWEDVRSKDIFSMELTEGARKSPRGDWTRLLCCSDSRFVRPPVSLNYVYLLCHGGSADATTSDKLAVVLSAVFAGAGGTLGWMSLRPNMLCSPCVTHSTSFIYGQAVFWRRTIVHNSDCKSMKRGFPSPYSNSDTASEKLAF